MACDDRNPDTTTSEGRLIRGRTGHPSNREAFDRLTGRPEGFINLEKTEPIPNNFMKTKGKTYAVAYLRTSSATNAEGDSQVRQRAAIAAFSKTAGFELVDEFADVAVSGADPIESREGFAHLLDRIEGNGVRIVIIEDASRLARQAGHARACYSGADRPRLLTANGDDLTDDSDPSRVMMRQIAGAFHQYEKARLVAKLKAARDRKRATGARAEGRLSHAEKRPEVVMLAKQLRRKLPKGGRKSYSEIAAELFVLGHANSNGVAFSKSSIKSMLEG